MKREDRIIIYIMHDNNMTWLQVHDLITKKLNEIKEFDEINISMIEKWRIISNG